MGQAPCLEMFKSSVNAVSAENTINIDKIISKNFWNRNLRLLHGRCLTVAHGADVYTASLLLVALSKELLHDALNPLVVQRLRLGWIAQVSTVRHVLQNLISLRRTLLQ